MRQFKGLDHLWKFYILLVGLNLGMKPLFAQTITQKQPTKVPSTPKVPVPRSSRKSRVKIPSPPIVNKEVLSSNRQTIKVERFEFKGNKVFSDRQLQALIGAYLGRNLTFDELLEIRSLITNFYNKAGYINSFAFLSISNNQQIGREKGVVTIQIIEGKIEKITISGGSRLKGYIRSRLKKATSPVLNRTRLLESLQLLQTDRNIERISAELSEASELGKNVLNVKVKIREPLKLGIVADNSRSPTVGTFQRGVSVKHTNLFGLGDSLGFDYRNTEGSNAYSVGYSVPINTKNGTIDVLYTSISSNIIEEPFNDLDIVSDTRSYQVSFRQPIIRHSSENSTQEFALGLTGERIESESSLSGSGFPLSEGADDQGRTRISALRFFQDWSIRKENTAFQLRSQLSLGIGGFDATVNGDRPDSRFFAWRGQGVWLRRLGKTSLLLRGDLQLASRPLVSLEQISLGGVSTIRGYRYSTYLSDNALLLGAELRIPVMEKRSSELKIIPFVDFGHSWNNARENKNRIISPELGSLLSVGLGVEYKLNSKFTTRLDWGIPLIDDNTNNSSNTWQGNGIHLNLRYQPF